MTNAAKPACCTAVDEHIAKPIPSILWHYTTFAGLQGIITSKTIWATSTDSYNDREKFQHAKSLAVSVAEEEPEYTGEGFPSRYMVPTQAQRSTIPFRPPNP